MERDLVDWAARIYKHVVVKDDRIHVITDKVRQEQDRLIAEKPRRKAVSVYFTVDHLLGHAWVSIGTSTINLVLVQGEIA
jgi:hypothetical protein